MGWSLSHLHRQDEDAHDAFFLTLGRALYIASEFEAKCRYVWRTGKLVEAIDGQIDFSELLANAIRDKNLCHTLRELTGMIDCGPAQSQILLRAKDARNYMAHQAGQCGPLSYLTDSLVERHLQQIRSEMETLIAGDNLVSQWVYEIEEKEPAPSEIVQLYPQLVSNWVFRESDTHRFSDT